jgi:hypothetical protein
MGRKFIKKFKLQIVSGKILYKIATPLLLMQATRPLLSKGPSEATRDQNPHALRAQAPLSQCASQADRTVDFARYDAPYHAKHGINGIYTVAWACALT